MLYYRYYLKTTLVLLGLFILGSCGKKEQQAPPPLSAPFITITPKDVPIYKEFAGQTFGDLDIELTARVDGILTAIHFTEGQKVSKGQLLYSIDPLEYNTKVEQIKGQVASSQSALVNAEEELKRIKPLADMNAVSKRELDAAVARAKAAKSNLESVTATLKNQQLERSYCDIISPIDGVIGISNVRVGDYISRLGNNAKLNTVSRLSQVRVRFTISESEFLDYRKKVDLTAKKEQSNMELLLSDGSTHPYKGRLSLTDAKIDPTTGTMTIECIFPNPNNILRAGQFSKVRTMVENQHNAIAIPQKAVTEIQGIFQVLIIDKENKIQNRIVEVGQKVGKEWTILKGLQSGDRVAIVGSLMYQPGTVVTPVPYVEKENNTL
ncbi:efflux RND transporter periplasmic adaptor subunit [Flavobacterium sp. RSSA_27]|uniref:efflux RND transporter periplasmic adaptor subunit n=1 Tax=Flavobacterium sp. RSSA_27 TaxID=3447667 RepID=UPI003F3BEE21